MKIAYVVDNHSPAYGGPYTVISDQAYSLYKNDIKLKVVQNEKRRQKIKFFVTDTSSGHLRR